MIYKILTEQQREDMVTNTLLAQETDHFLYSANIARYTAIATQLDDVIDKEYKDKILASIEAERRELTKVEKTLIALQDELPMGTKLEDAIVRLQSKKE